MLYITEACPESSTGITPKHRADQLHRGKTKAWNAKEQRCANGPTGPTPGSGTVGVRPILSYRHTIRTDRMYTKRG